MRKKPITKRELHIFDNRINRRQARQKGLHLDTILTKITFRRFKALYENGYIRAVAVNHFDHNNGKSYKGKGFGITPRGRLNAITQYSKSSKHSIIGTQQSKYAIQNCR